MWKRLNESQPPLYLSFNEKHNDYEILVTDYISLWYAYFTKENFHSTLKECNDHLEFETEDEIFQQGIAMLEKPEKIKNLQVEREDGDKVLYITMYMSFGYPFKFECKLAKSSERFFFEKVTKHLLTIIKDLSSSQTKLRVALKRKDKVMKAFKDKGVSLNARRFRIDADEFNDEAHMSEHKEYETLFGSNEIPEIVLRKTETLSNKQTATTNFNVKVEPGSVKMEPETPSYDSMNIKRENVKTEPQSSSVKKQKTKLNI